MAINIEDAVKAINPDAAFSCHPADSTSGITWLEGTSPISAEVLEAKKVELQAEYDALEYSRNRKKEYPAIVDQLDDIYHNGIDGWKATIKVTKDKYPKA